MNTSNVTLSSSEKLGLISNLSTMLAAGIPILEVVDTLATDSKGNTKKILDVLREDLMQGNRVYVTFSKFPQVFNKVSVNVLRAAEEAGTLDVTLKDLKQNMQKEEEFLDKVKFALLYPSFIVGVFLAVLLVILLVVVPKIASVFTHMHVVLPLPTRILIFISDALVHSTAFIVGGLSFLIVGMFLLFKRRRGLIVSMFVSLPLISRLVKQIDLTRFSRSLYLLLYAGLPITEGLALTADVVMRRDLERIITTTRDMVMTGKRLSDGFRSAKGYFPAIMVKLVEAGERTGTLDKSMQDISEYFDYQVTKTLKTLTSLLEPVMLIVVGVLVGGMMLAIIAPIYGLIGQIGTR